MSKPIAVLIMMSAILTGCGTVKEKTAPCKRPAHLSSFVEDSRQACPVMHPVNDPAAAFVAIGVGE